MRGQLYSLIAVLLVIPLIFFVAFYVTATQSIKLGTVEKIVADQEHQISNSLDNDFGRVVSISGKRALLAAINEVMLRGNPIGSAVDGLEELLVNGTLDGNESFVIANNTLEDWKAGAMEAIEWFTLVVDYYNLTIENHDGFNLRYMIGADINVTDKLNISRITKSTAKDVLISVDGLEDPMFPLETQGYVRRTISRHSYPYCAIKIVSGTAAGECSGEVTFDAGSPDSGKILVVQNGSGISGFAGVVSESGDLPSVGCYVVGAANAVGLVNETVQGSGYTELYLDSGSSGVWSMPILEGVEYGHYYAGTGPDMLYRLEGSLDTVANGINTFVNIPQLQALGIETKPEQTRLAYLYFSDQIYTGQQVRGMPDWFRIGAAHAGDYNLTELLES